MKKMEITFQMLWNVGYVNKSLMKMKRKVEIIVI